MEELTIEERKKRVEEILVENFVATTKKPLDEKMEHDLNILGASQRAIDKVKKDIKDKAIHKNKQSLKAEFAKLTHLKQWGEATEILVSEILSKNYIYTTKVDEKNEMWIYKNGIYLPQGKTEIREQLREILEEFYSEFYANQVISKIQTDTGIDIDMFFKTNYKEEVPVLNGILNIFTRELAPFDPSKIFFNKLPVKYDFGVKCESIDKFLDDVLPNKEDKNVFYELGGFCLLKEYTFEKAFMFVGNGRNGKGKSLELIKRVLGAENCYGLPLSALQHDNADVSQLFGKMVNLAGDIGNKDLQDTSMFKSLTGRDTITAKRKFLRAISFENYAKFVFACNELPMVYDMSKGFWDRWVLLEFPYTFEDKDVVESSKDKLNLKVRDEDIINKITTEKELCGLLNAFLDGLDRLVSNRKFSSTKGTEEIKNMWIRKSNSFIAFCMDNIEEEYDEKISKKELRKEYSKYCKEHKLVSKSDFVIKKVLQDMFGASEERLNNKDNWEQFWIGIKSKKVKK